jgi:hypothetical protein
MVALMKGEPLTTLKRNCIPEESEDESDDKVESTAGRTPPASPTRTRQDMVALMKGEPLTTLKRNCIPEESEGESDDKVESTAGRTPPASPTHELNLVASYANASQGEKTRLLNFLHSVGALSTSVPNAAESLDAPSSPPYTPSSPSYDPCSPPWFP